jgi:Lrp/AsnC family transcriptional regulator, regulator for asnA, asnC and gidA
MLDNLERELVIQLQKSGRQSYVELATSLKRSERTIRNKIKSLLEREIIKIIGVPNIEALGYDFVGVVGLNIQLSNLYSIAETLMKHPNVGYLSNVTGRYDIILIVVTKSSREFAQFMEEVISKIPGIVRTETFVTLHTYKGDIYDIDTEKLLGKSNKTN